MLQHVSVGFSHADGCANEFLQRCPVVHRATSMVVHNGAAVRNEAIHELLLWPLRVGEVINDIGDADSAKPDVLTANCHEDHCFAAPR